MFDSIASIRAIYKRHLSKDIPRAEARGHAAALLVINGHCASSTEARSYVIALFA